MNMVDAVTSSTPVDGSNTEDTSQTYEEVKAQAEENTAEITTGSNTDVDPTVSEPEADPTSVLQDSSAGDDYDSWSEWDTSSAYAETLDAADTEAQRLQDTATYLDAQSGNIPEDTEKTLLDLTTNNPQVSDDGLSEMETLIKQVLDDSTEDIGERYQSEQKAEHQEARQEQRAVQQQNLQKQYSNAEKLALANTLKAKLHKYKAQLKTITNKEEKARFEERIKNLNVGLQKIQKEQARKATTLAYRTSQTNFKKGADRAQLSKSFLQKLLPGKFSKYNSAVPDTKEPTLTRGERLALAKKALEEGHLDPHLRPEDYEKARKSLKRTAERLAEEDSPTLAKDKSKKANDKNAQEKRLVQADTKGKNETPASATDPRTPITQQEVLKKLQDDLESGVSKFTQEQIDAIAGRMLAGAQATDGEENVEEQSNLGVIIFGGNTNPNDATSALAGERALQLSAFQHAIGGKLRNVHERAKALGKGIAHQRTTTAPEESDPQSTANIANLSAKERDAKYHALMSPTTSTPFSADSDEAEYRAQVSPRHRTPKPRIFSTLFGPDGVLKDATAAIKDTLPHIKERY